MALKNRGQVVNSVAGTPGADISALEAWSITTGSSSVVIALIDTGADINHVNLVDNLYDRNGDDWNFADDSSVTPDDTNGHGTHVCGTAAARDVAEILGVAPGCKFIPLKVSLIAGLVSSRADAINHVASLAANHPNDRFIVNCSWKLSGDVASIRIAFENAVNANVLPIVAAGNQSTDLDQNRLYPASYPDVVTVAATDCNDEKAPFSNWGTRVDLCAPGVQIYSTYPSGHYTFLSGTSQQHHMLLERQL